MIMLKIIILCLAVFNFFIPIFSIKETNRKLIEKHLEIDLDRIQRTRKIELIIYSFIGVFIPSAYFIMWTIVCVFLSLRTIFKINKLLQSLKDDLNYQFPIWIRFVQSNLQNNTVYQSLYLSLDNCSHLLKGYVKKLIQEVENNPLQINHYETFMEEFDNYEIKKMMMHLYRYNFIGTSESTHQLQSQITASNQWIEETRQQLFNKYREWYKWLVILPMISVTFLFILLMFQVMVSILEGGWSL